MRLSIACLIVVLCTTATSVYAQIQPGVVGVGVSLNPTALLAQSDGEALFLPIGFTNIHVPVTPSANIRIEPEFGLYSTSQTIEGNDTSFAASLDRTTSFTRIGTGVYYRMPLGEAFSSYVGPKVGLMFMSEERTESFMEEKETRSESSTHLTIGAALGGEYLVSQHFGFGAEVQFNYVSLGEPTVTYTPSQPSSSPSADNSRSLMSTNALMYARFYF